ncbi:MAG: ORF6N domain-containing protein [Chitinophagaceae bacterium]|nr:ORF6N domain-containing protein [Chitinophagaceae bacterium]
MEIIRSIQNRIYEIRGERVMLDRDLAALYEIDTKSLNLSVKRNIKRFPSDFMFQLTKEEIDNLRFQIETSSLNNRVILEGGASKGWGGARYLPYAFTEQGVAMLSGVLHSDKAISMNIAIMRAFVEIRHIIFKQNDLKEQLREIKERLSEHDVQLNHIYDAMENLLDEKAAERKWEQRERIGFRK